MSQSLLSGLFGKSESSLNAEYKKRADNAEKTKTELGTKIQQFQKTSAAYISPRNNKEYYDNMISRLDPEAKNKELTTVKNYLMNFHNNFPAEFQDSSAGLFEYISKNTQSQLKQKYDSIKANNKNITPEVAKVIEDVKGSMEDVFMKYRFFEYKYVQTNIILLDFIKASREIFSDYAEYSNKFAATLIIQNMRNMKILLETILSLQVNNDEQRLSEDSIKELNGLITDKMKEGSDMYQQLLEKHADMIRQLDETMKSLQEGAQADSQKRP